MQFPSDDEPQFSCLDCLDEPNGWAIAWCFGAGKLRVHPQDKPERSARAPIAFCGRDNLHQPHDWAHRCHCYGHNETVRKRRERETIRRADKKREHAA